MSSSVQTLKGFRDFLPVEKRKRDYIAAKWQTVFALYGFEPLETPTLEYASLLLGKYGDEADKLVYTFEDRGARLVGLRYDQTVPTSRVLGQYQNQLPKYFRRYQMQNVFRADKPQKGRFREFAQCDIDIFGSASPLADAEILACTYAGFKAIGFEQVVLKLNDRQTLLATLQPLATDQVGVFSIIQSVDKLDKLPESEIIEELVNKGLTVDRAQQALASLQTSRPSDNLQEIIRMAVGLGVPESALQFDATLARGLDYYTGMIFEVRLPQYKVGSLGGGGRYDNLIEQLSGLRMPAVGIGLGFDRIVEAADQLGLIPTTNTGTKVLVALFDENTLTASLQAAAELRASGIPTEVFPCLEKLGKQFKLADQKGIPFVLLIGGDEAAAGQVLLKNMRTGEQFSDRIDKIIELYL